MNTLRQAQGEREKCYFNNSHHYITVVEFSPLPLQVHKPVHSVALLSFISLILIINPFNRSLKYISVGERR